jgi:hypothetical protein
MRRIKATDQYDRRPQSGIRWTYNSLSKPLHVEAPSVELTVRLVSRSARDFIRRSASGLRRGLCAGGSHQHQAAAEERVFVEQTQ